MALTWRGLARAPQVSRSRAMPAGGQPSSPGGGSAVARHPALERYAPRRAPSRRLGSLPPRPCGPLCRCEHRRSRACAPSALSRARRNCIFTASPEVGVPLRAYRESKRRIAERKKPTAANFVRCPRVRGESVKGAPPLHKTTTTNRNLPQRAAGAQGSCDSRARSGWESGPPTPTPPAPGSPRGSRRTSEARHEVPGGSAAGPAAG